MYRRTDDKAVACKHLIQCFVDAVILKDTAARAGFGAFAASDAAADSLIADKEDFGFDALFFKRIGDFAQSGVCAAFFVRAAIEQKNLHDAESSLIA